jgi:hypothetical protein
MPSHSTRRRDITGQRFGRLTVEKRVPRPSSVSKRATYWLCRCDCKSVLVVRQDALTTGNTQSCGCGTVDATRLRSITHGLSGTTTYTVWWRMRQRCEDQNDAAYHDYGGRGITVCARWHSFESFLEDMGERPEGLTIERINNDGSYEPSNCRWATRTEQGRNKRSNRLLTYGGETRPLSEWAEIKGLRMRTLWARLYVYNWTLDRALTTQVSTFHAS